MSDYKVDPKVAGVVSGVIYSTHKGDPVSVKDAINKRLNFHEGRTPCFRHEVLLPPGACDLYGDLDAAIHQFDSQRFADQRDLLIVFTMQFEQGGAIHDQWEAARAFAREHLVVGHRLAVALIQHQPGLSGRPWNKPHVHALAFARELHASHFQAFSSLRELGNRAALAAKWLPFRDAHR